MNSRTACRKVTGRCRGLTLIEMMIAIGIIIILLGVAMPIYSHSIRRAREANLRKNLETLNNLIFQYALDKQKAPQSLDDLKAAGYIDKVPQDIDGADWVPEPAEAYLSLDQIASMGQATSLNEKSKGDEEKDTGDDGIIGVHSGSDHIGSDGRPYSEW